MKKKEFMAMSLPYGLKCIYSPFDEPDSVVDFSPSRYSMMITKEYDYKPILRQLSDLTKPITHNGETFVPMDYFFYEFGYYPNTSNVEHLQYQVFQKLIEWHFNLMDESEPFIPVTEEFNPYK